MTFQLLLRSVGRVLWFAVAGAFCMALVGIVAGSVTGAIVMLIYGIFTPRTPSATLEDVWIGTWVGGAYALSTGLRAGFLAFASAGTIACFSLQPKKIFGASWGLARRSVVIATLIGALLGVLNSFLWRQFFPNISTDVINGYMIGVISGFILGTFYGAIVGAWREVARQKTEQVQQQNAPLSIDESGAL